jgi:hypothetical protein
MGTPSGSPSALNDVPMTVHSVCRTGRLPKAGASKFQRLARSASTARGVTASPSTDTWTNSYKDH